LRILIVEDEILVAMEIEGILRDAGHETLGPVATARDALALAERATPDLALVNINLLDGKGAGIGLARALLGRWRVPSIFVSGQRAEAEAARDAAIGFIDKPWRERLLLESVGLVERIRRGGRPDAVPAGLRLFETGH
jgi:DNA-binding response OmpR family regulator